MVSVPRSAALLMRSHRTPVLVLVRAGWTLLGTGVIADSDGYTAVAGGSLLRLEIRAPRRGYRRHRSGMLMPR